MLVGWGSIVCLASLVSWYPCPQKRASGVISAAIAHLQTPFNTYYQRLFHHDTEIILDVTEYLVIFCQIQCIDRFQIYCVYPLLFVQVLILRGDPYSRWAWPLAIESCPLSLTSRQCLDADSTWLYVPFLPSGKRHKYCILIPILQRRSIG